MEDYYQILGVAKNATAEEIKKAYRKLAHQYHPDKTKGDDKKFKEINEAYQILSNEKKRAEYDTYGRVFGDNAGGGFGGFGGFQGDQAAGWDFSAGAQGFDINDIFESFFGGGNTGRGARVKRGRDISIDVEISFEESVFGVKRVMLLAKTSLCDKCSGSGAEPGASMEKCSFCQGAGRIHETKKSFFGAFTSQRECEKCSGKGSIPSKKCSSCKGRGVLTKNEEVTIQIPPGIENGEMIKIAGMGEAVANGVAGDLYVKIYVARHSIFSREGENLKMDLDIKMSEAALGGEREIKTLDGAIKLKIPSGVDSGEILRLRGKGIPRRSGGRGDLMVRLLIRTPKKISRKAKELMESLKKEGL